MRRKKTRVVICCHPEICDIMEKTIGQEIFAMRAAHIWHDIS